MFGTRIKEEAAVHLWGISQWDFCLFDFNQLFLPALYMDFLI